MTTISRTQASLSVSISFAPPFTALRILQKSGISLCNNKAGLSYRKSRSSNLSAYFLLLSGKYYPYQINTCRTIKVHISLSRYLENLSIPNYSTPFKRKESTLNKFTTVADIHITLQRSDLPARKMISLCVKTTAGSYKEMIDAGIDTFHFHADMKVLKNNTVIAIAQHKAYSPVIDSFYGW